MDGETGPKVRYEVEFQAGSLRLRLTVNAKSVPVPITPEQAADLGRSLIAASIRSTARGEGLTDLAPDGPVGNCDLPVVSWQTGMLRDPGLAILTLEMLGGSRLTLQLRPRIAEECGQALCETGRNLRQTD